MESNNLTRACSENHQKTKVTDDPNLSVELEEHPGERGGAREEQRRSLDRQREQLVERMEEKVKLMKEDQAEVEEEMVAVKEEGERLVSLVEKEGSLVEGDKVRVHLQEVERLASLLGVLAGRLARTDKMLERGRQGTQAVSHFPVVCL